LEVTPGNEASPQSRGWLLNFVAASIFAAAVLLAAPGGAAASYVTITSPASGATVKGTISIATSESSDVSWYNLFVDAKWVASNPAGFNFVWWNSATVPDGSHTILIMGYDSSNYPIASGGISITVKNGTTATPSASPKPTAKPTPTPTRKPTAFPTPGLISSCISITAPVAGATVSGSSVAVATKDTCLGLWFESLYVDGSHVGDFASGKVIFNSTTFSNGTHTIKPESGVKNRQSNPQITVHGARSMELRRLAAADYGEIEPLEVSDANELQHA
jgi:hypothetical protein